MVDFIRKPVIIASINFSKKKTKALSRLIVYARESNSDTDVLVEVERLVIDGASFTSALKLHIKPLCLTG